MELHYFSQNQITPLYLSAVVPICSILFFNVGKTKISLYLLFLGSLGLGYFMANLDPFLIIWDEQYHALVAKNMMSHPFKPKLYENPLLGYDYRNWTENHIWLHKQPLFLWQIALSLKLFGCNTLAVRLPSIILHALAVLLTYRIGKISINERIGFYAALFFATAYYPLELLAGRYSTDHNDLSFLFYVTASIWAWFEYQNSRKNFYLILIGLFSGCAILVKWLVGLLVYAIWFITIGINDKENWIELKSYRPLFISLLITISVFIPWQIYILLNFPLEANYEFSYNTKHFFEPLESHGGDIWFHLEALNDIYGSGAIVPYLYLIGLLLFLKNTKIKIYRYALLSAIIITYGFYSIASTKMTSFCIIVAPLAFLGLASLVDSVATIICSKIPQAKFELLFRSIILITTCAFLLNLTKIQNYHTDWKPHDNCNRNAELQEMEFIEKLKELPSSEKYVVFNANSRLNGHIPIMFFTNYIAYNFIPSEMQIEHLESKKYKIAILEKGDLPDYIKRREEIIKIKF